jgi:tryptophanyl-tRNA synthetase
MLDDLNVIKKKIKSAVTDLETSVHYDPKNKPGISNLMTIYSVITGLSFDEIQKKYEGKGYGDFKGDLAEIVAEEVGKVQEAFHKWYNSPDLDRILDEGKMKAEYLASKKMSKIKKKFGYGRK